MKAIVGVSPLIDPRAFQFPPAMADEFAEMLNGVSGQDLLDQWERLTPLFDVMRAFAPREMLLVAAGKDSICPAAQYTEYHQIAASHRVDRAERERSRLQCTEIMARANGDGLVGRETEDIHRLAELIPYHPVPRPTHSAASANAAPSLAAGSSLPSRRSDPLSQPELAPSRAESATQ